MTDKNLWNQVVEILRSRRVWNKVIFSFAFKHGSEKIAKEYLEVKINKNNHDPSYAQFSSSLVLWRQPVLS